MLPIRNILIELAFALPDIAVGIFFVILAMTRLIIGDKHSQKIFPKLSVLMAGIGFIVALFHGSFAEEFKTTLFTYNYNLSCMKSILLGISMVGFIVMNRLKVYRSFDSSLYFLVFGLINSIMLCISANSFLSLIVGLELYSFSVGFLLLIYKETTEFRKSAVRFVLISSVMTALLMFGVSLYYTQFVCLSFHKIHLDSSLASIAGSIFIISGLLFKIGVAPFHSWMIDLYEKASTLLIMFLDTIWKFFMIFIFTKVFRILIAGEADQYRAVLTILSVMSMVIGGIMPLFQENIKKFMACASVGHIGFVLTVFATASTMQPISSVLSYLAAYSIAAICFFLTIILLKRHKPIERFKDLTGLMRNNPTFGFVILSSMLAMVSLPPFANFTAKVDIFKLLIGSGNSLIVAASIVYSVLAVFCVAKCMRHMFMQPVGDEHCFAGLRSKAVVVLQMSMGLLIFLYGSMSKLFATILE
jgi:NADH-quinone oxidoreductase subunit N